MWKPDFLILQEIDWEGEKGMSWPPREQEEQDLGTSLGLSTALIWIAYPPTTDRNVTFSFLYYLQRLWITEYGDTIQCGLRADL